MGWLSRLETKHAPEDPPFIPIRLGLGEQPHGQFNYTRAVRGGIDANVIMAPIQWIMRTFPEAEAVVQRRMGEKPWQTVFDHPLQDLLLRPNRWMNGTRLFQCTALSFLLDGNAYWLKRRNAFGGVVELWYVPFWAVEPVGFQDGSDGVAHYAMTSFRGRPQEVHPDDMVHFAFGQDDRDPLRGLSQVKTLMREVFTDEEAARFSASILRKMGVPGLLIAPKDVTSVPGDGDVEEVKRYIDGTFTAEGRGGTMVLSAPTDVKQFGFDPNQLNLTGLRDISEERVCAALGLPAAVVGFGSGMQSTKVGATMRELRQAAWNQCLIPAQNQIAEQVSDSLLPDFEGKPRRWRVAFDRSQVSAFQEEETARADRIAKLVAGGVLRVDKGQELAGLEVDPSQAVYLRPSGVTVVEVGDSGVEPAPLEPPPPAPVVNPTLEEVMAEASKALQQRRGVTRNGNGVHT